MGSGSALRQCRAMVCIALTRFEPLKAASGEASLLCLGRQRDRSVNGELRENSRDAQRGVDLQGLVALEGPALQCRGHGLLDLPLGGDAETLQELPNLEVEEFLIHES